MERFVNGSAKRLSLLFHRCTRALVPVISLIVARRSLILTVKKQKKNCRADRTNLTWPNGVRRFVSASSFEYPRTRTLIRRGRDDVVMSGGHLAPGAVRHMEGLRLSRSRIARLAAEGRRHGGVVHCLETIRFWEGSHADRKRLESAQRRRGPARVRESGLRRLSRTCSRVSRNGIEDK